MLGSTLLDRYRIDAELGKGGMGIVYRGHDLVLNRSVALKVLNAAYLSETGKARLLTEARAAAKLNLTQPAVSRRARGLTRDPWSSNVPAGTLGIGR